MKSPILGSSYVARSVNAADNRCVNLFPEAVPEGGKEPGFLSRAPGLVECVTVGAGPIRGMWRMGNYGYIVSGQELYRMEAPWTLLLLGTVTGTGPVSMADNGTMLFIACGGTSFTYYSDTGVLRQITDINFPGAMTVAYLDGYMVYNPPGTQYIYVVATLAAGGGVIDPLVFDPLDVASAEGSPDGVVALIADHRELWVFGTSSVEVWYNSGGTDFPLSRVQGAYNEIGCAAPFSVAKLDNALFWLGSDVRGRGIVYRANGYTGVRVSTHALEWQIQQYVTISDAIAYTYQQDGHAFYVLTFPRANATWVYDAATQVWHERAGFGTSVESYVPASAIITDAGEIVIEG